MLTICSKNSNRTCGCRYSTTVIVRVVLEMVVQYVSFWDSLNWPIQSFQYEDVLLSFVNQREEEKERGKTEQGS